MSVQAKYFASRVWGAVRQAVPPALRTALWIIKLTIPISLGMSVLSYLGVVQWVSVQLGPLFATMGLGGEAALVFISAALGNIYTGIAVIFTVGIDFRSAVILAAMMLICHNLIIETAIQSRSGASAFWMPVLRVGTAVLCGILLNLALPGVMAGELHATGHGVAEATSWAEVLGNWARTLAPLILKMLVLITLLNILQNILREFKILDLIAYPLRPLMHLFGLPVSTSFLWIICNVIGLAYGGAALIDELQRGKATPGDARLLNTHVAISHSLLEDTLLFMAIGLPLFWLMVPRVLLAFCAVWIQRLGRSIKNRTILRQA